MHAKDQKINEFINGEEKEFEIPTYQRSYDWGKSEVRQLIDDLYEISDNQGLFLGTIVNKGKSKGNLVLKLIDGQQRITTILLLSKVISKIVPDEGAKVLSSVIFKSAEGKMKMKRINDANILHAILSDKTNKLFLEQNSESNYVKNYQFMREKINESNVEKIWNSLKKVQIAKIDLDDYDDEHAIFESINSKGKSLTSVDLIKSYVDSKWVESKDEKSSYAYIMDNDIIDLVGKGYLLDFIRQFLAYKTSELFTKTGKTMFLKFKILFPEFNDTNMIELVNFARIWNYIYSLGDKNLFEAYLRTTNTLSLLPMISMVISKYSQLDTDKKIKLDKNQKIIIENKNEYLKELKTIVQYDILRMFNGFSRVEGNRSYPKIAKDAIEKKKTLREILVADKQETSLSMPKISNLENKYAEIDLYNSNRNKLKNILIFCENVILKNNSFKSISNRSEYSIEHILPQSKVLLLNDGETLMHTLGNLSVVKNDVNSKLSNLTLKEKQKILKDRSYLKINKSIYEMKNISNNSIRDRASEIFKLILDTFEIK